MRWKAENKILWLILAAVAARIILSLLFKPLLTPDSYSYLEMARQIATGDFSGYQAVRTPVYPLFLVLCKFNIQTVVLAQMILGLVISLTIYRVIHQITGGKLFAFAAGLSYALNPSLIIFERAVLTETLTTLLVAVSLLVFLKILNQQDKMPALFLLVALSSLAALTRPLFLFLPFLFSVLLVIHLFRREDCRVYLVIRPVIGVFFPVVLLLCSWCWFNYSKTGYFQFTSITGASLLTHTEAFIEKAPSEYDALKKIFLKYRDQQITETGNAYNTYYPARKELMEKLNLNFFELNKVLNKLSLDLIVDNPADYLKSVAGSFVRFWYPTWYANQGGIRKTMKSGNLPVIFLLGSFALAYVLCIATFWAFPLIYALSPRIRDRFAFGFHYFSIYLIVLSTALTQALSAAQENARYKVPVEPLIIALAVTFALILYKPSKASR